MFFGEKLRALRTRAGVSIRAAAADAGMKSASNWQHYESPKFEGWSLPADYTVRLASAWQGKGDPVITMEDVLELTPELAEFVAGHGSSLFTGSVRHKCEDITLKIDIQTTTIETLALLTEAFSSALRKG